MAWLTFRDVDRDDASWIPALVAEHFASTRVVSRGRLIDTSSLPGIVALASREVAGLLLYEPSSEGRRDIEVVVLIAVARGKGVGRALLERMEARARSEGSLRLWLVTTNNNVNAIGFYRALEWRLAAVHEGAVNAARTLKPEIPLVDGDGRAITDEWEFERRL